MLRSLTTRDKIIELGRDFVQKLGYHAFKYQLIAKELNIKNAAIHHYFPAKEDLGVAIIEKDQADFQWMVRSVADRPAFERVSAIIEVYRTYLNEGKNLCIVGACVSAYLEIPEKMTFASKRYQDMIYNWLVANFKEGLATGEFHFTDTPEDLAALWIATLPGTIQVAQARGKEYFEQTMNQLSMTVKATNQPVAN
ncbi:MAG TPA: TetR/AcrR family transcriptional regulator [Puia sp.]|nr:TetR/AcrR family transcriptional regulator [Puia sp.]